MCSRPKVPKSKHIDGNYDNGFIHHLMKAFSDNPLSPLIGIFNEDISSKIASNCIERYIQQSCHVYEIKYHTISRNLLESTDDQMTWPWPACLASTTCQVRRSTLVVDKWKTKTSLSRSSRTNILKSPANARSHLIKYGYYPTCNILPSTEKCRPRHQNYIKAQSLNQILSGTIERSCL